MWPITLVAALLAACDGPKSGGGAMASTSDAGQAGEQDAGPDAGNDAGSDTGPWSINVRDVVDLIQAPLAGEGPVTGAVQLLLGTTHDHVGGILSVNGVNVPQSADGFFDLGKVAIPGAVAGGTLTFVANSRSQTHTLVVACPKEVAIVSPLENSLANTGDAIPVNWDGSIDYSPHLFSPRLEVGGYNALQNVKSGTSDVSIPPAASEADVTIPETSEAGYLITLSVPGTTETTADGTGTCELQRRVHLVRH